MSDDIIPLEEASRHFDRNKKIIAMIEDGNTYAEIGRQVGLTRARVSQIALDYGYVVRPSLVSEKRKKV